MVSVLLGDIYTALLYYILCSQKIKNKYVLIKLNDNIMYKVTGFTQFKWIWTIDTILSSPSHSKKTYAKLS